jgi:hypothetical protein
MLKLILTPVLLILLFYSASIFPVEEVAAESRQTVASAVAQKKLPAAGSNAEASQNALFDQLVGTWDVRYEFTDKNGKLRSNRGQVHYSWILGGKALQEIWTSDSESKDLLPFGTTIDFYDLKRQRWTAVWIYPAEGMAMIMTGGDVNGSFVLTGHDQSGALQRWSTSVGQRDSIVIRAEISNDEGKTWRPMGVSYLQRH